MGLQFAEHAICLSFAYIIWETRIYLYSERTSLPLLRRNRGIMKMSMVCFWVVERGGGREQEETKE